MSKFFINVIGMFRAEIEPKLYDNLDDVLSYLKSKPDERDSSCTIYEVTDTNVNNYMMLRCFSKGVWLDNNEYEFRKTIDYGILSVRDRFIQSGNHIDEWNEWATKHNLVEEYLIK